MNSKIDELIKKNKEYQDVRKIKDLRKAFKEVLETFIAKHYPDGIENETLMCSIHGYFTSGHNCVACNLNESNKRIERYLLQYKSFNDINLTFTNFIFLLYLQVESIHAYFSLIHLKGSYKLEYYEVFTEVKRWANFLKHPKAFMLVHHPIWAYRGMRNVNDSYESKAIEKAKEQNEIINSDFVKEFYKSEEKRDELYSQLVKKEEMVVVFPDPIDLMERFIEAQERFVRLISEDEIVREVLQDEATILHHFRIES